MFHNIQRFALECKLQLSSMPASTIGAPMIMAIVVISSW
jgi:hypothetical protein